MVLIRAILWIVISCFLFCVVKWMYIIYKTYESYLPDVRIPLRLETGYKYKIEYIPPNVSLKEQTWRLDIEGISFNKEYEAHIKKLMLIDNLDYANWFSDGYLYPNPIIKTNVKNLDTGEIYENVISFQNRHSSYVCNESLQNIWCYQYRANLLTGERWLRFSPNKKYLIEIEVFYSDTKQADLKVNLVLGDAHFKKAYRF